MGRSDPHVFSEYLKVIPQKQYKKVAFLGFPGFNDLTCRIDAKTSVYFDPIIGNWEINDGDWDIGKDYDLIICTRCPYFAKDPKAFFSKCCEALSPDGYLFVDWGLGDHWRFESFKIGWVKDGEHEWAYHEDNFLWSCVWDDIFLNHPAFNIFSERVKKLGYENVKEAIFKEVPSVFELKEIKENVNISAHIFTLWEDKPQLYIALLCNLRKDVL